MRILSPARLLDVLLPPACAGCGVHLPALDGTRGKARRRICPRCLSRLKSPPHPRCGRCDAPRGTGLPEDRECGECSDWPAGLRGARASALLVPPADALVHSLKYGGWPELADDLAERMARVPLPGIPGLAGSTLVPVPTTRARLRARGYNQAGALARSLARLTGANVVEALERKDGGGSQVALHRGERRANVQGAFTLGSTSAKELEGTDVVLVDDVLTTGATASEAAGALCEGGVRSVTLLTFARALPE
jgi:ComF family protein